MNNIPSFLVLASLLIAVRADFLVTELYSSNTCSGSSTFLIYNSLSCGKDLDGGVLYYKYSVDNGTITQYSCTDSACTSCTSGAIGVTDTCYNPGLKYRTVSSVGTGAGVYYYSDSTCSTVVGAQVYQSEYDGVCVIGPSDNYLFTCLNNDVSLSECSGDDCLSGCSTTTYTSGCTADGPYYTAAKCSGSTILSASVVLIIAALALLM